MPRWSCSAKFKANDEKPLTGRWKGSGGGIDGLSETRDSTIPALIEMETEKDFTLLRTRTRPFGLKVQCIWAYWKKRRRWQNPGKRFGKLLPVPIPIPTTYIWYVHTYSICPANPAPPVYMPSTFLSLFILSCYPIFPSPDNRMWFHFQLTQKLARH